MAFNDQDEDEDVSEPSETFRGAVFDSLKESLRDPDDDDGPRQHPVVRWINFLVIMIVIGLVVAGLAAGATYGLSSDSTIEHGVHDATPISDQQWEDIKHNMKRNAIFGFVLGAGIGGIYVVKCLVRGVDP